MPFNIDASLRHLVDNSLPADYSAGCVFTPVEGLSSESWKITAGEKTLLARLASREKQRLGIDRRREYALLRHVSSTDIAPIAQCWAEPWLVVNWIDGETLTPPAFFIPASQQRLAAMLIRLHGLRPLGQTLDIKQRFESYWQSIDRRRITPAWLRHHKKMMRTTPPKTLKISVTHMDIHPQNWVNSPQGARLIDWEYAIAADIALEFAALFAGNGFSARQQQDLLQCYARHGGYHDISRLARQIRRWQPWLDYLMLMWFEVRWQQTADARYLDWAQPLRRQLFKE